VFEDLGLPFEFVLVDDGSTDGSWAIIQVLSARDPRIRGVHLMRNFGQHNALLAGIREARHELILTLDDDLQNPPDEVPKLIRRLDEDADVVYGTPIDPQHGFLRGLATSITKFALVTAIGSDIARQVSPFRLLRTRLRDAFDDYTGPNVSIDVLLSWGTTRFASVPVRHDRRMTGSSSYTPRKLIVHALNQTTGFSTRPLRIASIVGFVFSLFGVGVLIAVVARRLFQGNPVPGFAFLASVVAIFSGAQLFALGIIGEYLARMHFRLMDKPPYRIGARVGSDEDDIP
jgi:undecaprenyl-phosphate 4-deoxy-4-formamido-L-arabinose transferase